VLRNPIAWATVATSVALGVLLVVPSRLVETWGFPKSCARKGPITIIPLGRTSAGKWTAEFVERYKTPMTIESSMELPAEAIDAVHRQYVAEKLVLAAKSQRQRVGAETLIVLILDQDLRILQRPDWNYAFAYSDPSERTIVISLARMGLQSSTVNQSLPDRFSKMLARHLGSAYCGFERTGPPSSVMREDQVLGPDDLDQINERNWALERSPLEPMGNSPGSR
jgi:predicted Zn-dependent protease